MRSFTIWLLTLLTLTFSYAKILKEGSSCSLSNGQVGKCKKLRNCSYESLKNNNYMPTCNLKSRLYCCIDPITKNEVSLPLITSTTSTTTPPKQEKIAGWKSQRKCKYYSKLLDASNGKIGSACSSGISTKIIGGTKSSTKEYPHMAQWGYLIGSQPNYICGASIISEKYLLTAAHCQKDSKGPFVARLATDSPGLEIVVNITKKIPHPMYVSTMHYNDIALLRLEKPLKFTNYMRPACLETKGLIEQKAAIAAGWGRTSEEGKSSHNLLKVILPLLNISECGKIYNSKIFRKTLGRGLDISSMLCAGGRNLNKDTCKGDSGGPLLNTNKKLGCMYNIIGVTSFGGKCGTVPGVYTKVSSFIPWIESVVWPNNQ